MRGERSGDLSRPFRAGFFEGWDFLRGVALGWGWGALSGLGCRWRGDDGGDGRSTGFLFGRERVNWGWRFGLLNSRMRGNDGTAPSPRSSKVDFQHG